MLKVNSNRNRSGFTIVELLIVIVVIAVLATISVVAYRGVQARAFESIVRNDLSTALKKLEEYKIIHDGVYPMNTTELSEAGVSLTKNAYAHGIYCYKNQGNSQRAMIVIKIKSTNTSKSATLETGVINYSGTWSTGSLVCPAAGFADAESNMWLPSTFL